MFLQFLFLRYFQFFLHLKPILLNYCIVYKHPHWRPIGLCKAIFIAWPTAFCPMTVKGSQHFTSERNTPFSTKFPSTHRFPVGTYPLGFKKKWLVIVWVTSRKTRGSKQSQAENKISSYFFSWQIWGFLLLIETVITVPAVWRAAVTHACHRRLLQDVQGVFSFGVFLVKCTVSLDAQFILFDFCFSLINLDSLCYLKFTTEFMKKI
jgi:hypothetical protein